VSLVLKFASLKFVWKLLVLLRTKYVFWGHCLGKEVKIHFRPITWQSSEFEIFEYSLLLEHELYTMLSSFIFLEVFTLALECFKILCHLLCHL
jgi:hypothetical protein